MTIADAYFTTPDGARLAYRSEGEGLPLLCLPGLTRTMGDFDYLRPHLPPCRLIRMDYRGRGASQWTGGATYTTGSGVELTGYVMHAPKQTVRGAGSIPAPYGGGEADISLGETAFGLSAGFKF